MQQIDINTASRSIDFSFYKSPDSLRTWIDVSHQTIPANYEICTDLYYIFIYPLDHQQAGLYFIAPGQPLATSYKCLPYHLNADVLVFHPNLLKGTALASCLNDYTFFNHSIAHVLPLVPEQYQLAMDFVDNIKMELTYGLDKHSKRLIASNIELLFNYCERFSSCEFDMAEQQHRGLVQRFDRMLSKYFLSENPFKFGIPSVAYCAGELHLSPKYFGSLIKKETGRTAQEYIRDKILAEAKYRIVDLDKTINEIAYELGFKYPQHFCRYFKKIIGQTPNAYKQHARFSIHLNKNNFVLING